MNVCVYVCGYVYVNVPSICVHAGKDLGYMYGFAYRWMIDEHEYILVYECVCVCVSVQSGRI